ncbi:hypothetical protein ACOSP7_005161 [Xanthoceras sorbifolium]
MIHRDQRTRGSEEPPLVRLSATREGEEPPICRKRRLFASSGVRCLATDILDMKTSKLKSEADRDNPGVSAIQEWIQSDVMGVPGNSTMAADEVISVDLKVAMGALDVWENLNFWAKAGLFLEEVAASAVLNAVVPNPGAKPSFEQVS